MPNGSHLLVTGASGKLGRRVVELLLEAGEPHVYATTRTPDKLAHFAARGVTVRQGDFSDLASLPAAFTGIDRLLLISTDSLDSPGARERQHIAAVQAAAAAGVRHVVYTSLFNPHHSAIAIAPDHAHTEDALAASGLGYTILRNNMYTEMLLGVIGGALARGGQHVTASGEGRVGYVTREDCARIAAAALMDTFDGRRTLDVTGPESLTQADIAAVASAVTGQPVQVVPVPLDVLKQGMIGAGLPPDVAELMGTFETAIARGDMDGVSGAVRDLTGREPQRVADFLAQHADALRGGRGG